MPLGLQQDFQMHSGDSRRLEITVNDAAGSPVDLTGATAAKWELSKLDSSQALPTPRGASLIQKALASGVTIVDAVNGRVDVVLAPADTAALKGDFYHELEITSSSGDVSTVLFGKVEILKDLVV